MKKSILSALCLLLAIVWTGCKRAEPETPSTQVMLGTVVAIENRELLVEPMDGSRERDRSDRFCIPIAHMSASPEPQTGDLIAVLYNGDITGTYPAAFGQVLSVRVEKKAQAVCIDAVTYYNTGKAIPSPQEESTVEHVEIPLGGEASVSAFARLEEGRRLACLIGGEWYEFRAVDAK